jgi:hypothetical protein
VLLLSFALACTPQEPPAPAEPVEAAEPGHWKRLDTMAFGHVDHTATLLPGEQILVLGGFSPQVERVDVPAGRVRAASPLPRARRAHAAVALADGRALVCGGEVLDEAGRGELTSSCLSWDPATDTWSEEAPLSEARAELAMLTLDNGQVLAVGGRDAQGQASGTTDVWTDGVWTPGPEASPRVGPDLNAWGPVLTGGRQGGRAVAAVELWDGGAWRPLPPLDPPVAQHLTVVDAQGRLVVLGGADEQTSAEVRALSSTEADWETLPPLWTAREDLAGGLLPDDRLAVFGGRPVHGSPDALPVREVELLGPSGVWELGNRQVQARYEGATLPLSDGRIAVIGGHARNKIIQDVSVFSHLPKPPRVKVQDTAAPLEPEEPPGPEQPEPAEPTEPAEEPRP